MTLDQIDRMVRQANPVPDLTALEPVDASVLSLDQQRRTEMQTHDRVEVDREPEQPRRGLLIGIAAAAVILIGVLIMFRSGDDAPVAGQPAEASAVEIATGFLEAYAAFDTDRAASYLAADANISHLDWGPEPWVANKLAEAQGWKLLLDSCTEATTSISGTVRCTYDFHALRSDEIGLGPFSGSWFDVRVVEGKVTRVTGSLELDEFSPQMWEPFGRWVAEAYPDDAAIMYTDSGEERLTEESIALWDERSREYVEVVKAEPVQIATAFVEAYAAFDVDKAVSYLAADARLPELGGNVEGMRLETRWNEATGFKVVLDSCEEIASSLSGGIVRCMYDYHAIRSDEIGLGPFSGSYFDLTVLDGKIVSVSEVLVYEANGFSSQVWEPFALWVAEIYPDDVLVLYTDPGQTGQRYTDESIALWEQRSREYVEVVKAEA